MRTSDLQSEATAEGWRQGDANPLREVMPSALLTSGAHFGSLAAARCLGRRGVNIKLADSDRLSPTAASRFVTGFVSTPEPRFLDRFGQRLLEHGKSHRGAFLYPSSDDVVWVMACNREALSRFYSLYQPSAETIFTLLNKQRLYKQAQVLGIGTPTSYYPQSFAELAALQDELQFPLIVKPKTQIGLNINLKGLVSHNVRQLHANVRQFLERIRHADELLSYDQSVAWPIIQQFHPEARTETYSLSGFVTEDAGQMVVRAAKKVLQQPFQVGIGLAFESRQVDPTVMESVRNLCRATGFFGVFEAELIKAPGSNRFLLMDFNPRFYGQMGFDDYREMPLPYFAYLGALGQHAELAIHLKQAEQWDHQNPVKFSFGWMMRTLLATQRLGGQISGDFRREWLKWLDDDRNHDAVEDPDDAGVLAAYRRAVRRDCMRHPRSAFNYYFR